jgi:micrococcal nuclease
MYDYYAKVVAIVDADTIDVKRDAGADLWQDMRIRFNRVNAPERGTPEGVAAQAWLRDLLTNPDGSLKAVYLLTIKDKKEKYGRYLGDIWVWGEDFTRVASINDRMVDSGHARYHTY